MNNETIKKIREFNRFYTSIIGVTNNHILKSKYSLTEVRVMFELNKNPEMNARQLMNIMHVNEGYLSRIINKLLKEGIIKKRQLKEDKRHFTLQLSEKGKIAFEELNNRAAEDVSMLISGLNKKEQNELLKSFEQIKTLLTKK